MITLYCVSPNDEQLALENVRWWNELGGCPGHECYFLYDQRVNPDMVQAISKELAVCFRDVHPRRAGAIIDGWPEGANYMFRTSMGWISGRSYKYFLWMEPDATPLKEKWMDTIEREYLRGGKPFMGGRVKGVYEGKEVPEHMTGIAVYPNPIYEHAGEAYRAFDVAWDIAAKDQIIPKAYFTNLFCHAWHHPGFKAMFELDAIPPEAVIHHGVKDLSLINLLRQRRSGNLTIHAERPKEPVAIVSGSPAPLVSSADGDAMAAAKRHYGDIPSPCIHKLPNDIWVLEGDMISGVIKEKGRLDADELIPKILPLIKPGDVVIDGGAFVGDHAIAYSKAVGEDGMVVCFEPQPMAFECLLHNMSGLGNVFCHRLALGDLNQDNKSLSMSPNHYGGTFIGGDGSATVNMIALDSTGMKPNVIKLDLEGYELKALKGASETIMKYRPILILEINEEALGRQGANQGEIFSWLVRHWYYPQMLHDCSTPKSSLYDIVAFPKKDTGQVEQTS